MKKVQRPIAIAFPVHAVAWFLPVAKDGVTFPDGLPGWQAFSAKGGPWYDDLRIAIGLASTALFVLGAGWW